MTSHLGADHLDADHLDLDIDLLEAPRAWLRRQRLIRPLVNYTAAEMTRSWSTQSDLMRIELRRRRGEFKESGLFREAALPPWLDAAWNSVSLLTLGGMLGPVARAKQDAMQAGGTATVATAKLSLAFDVRNSAAQQYILNEATNRVKGINEESYRQIRTLIYDALENGTPYTQVERQLSELFSGWGKRGPSGRSRAQLVAVTEIGDAYEEGSLRGAKQVESVGIDMEKQWLSSRDARVTPACRTNDQAGWIELEDSFPSGHARPLRFPGCRCTALYRRKD